MKSFLLRMLGVGFLIMSETSVAATGSNLLLETSQGQIEIKLLPDIAPNHVARISELAASGFYDGIIFHRVSPDLWRKQAIQQAPAWVDQEPN